MIKTFSYDVVIPCYNPDFKLVRAVHSILMQSIKPGLILIVDDASDSAERDDLFEKIEKFDNCIKIIYLERNMGPANARNIGLTKCVSQFVAFLDCDDFWAPDIIDIYSGVLNFFEDVDIIFSKYELSGSNCINRSKIIRKRYIGFNDLIFHNYVATSSVMAKKSVFLSCQFDKTMRFSEDFDCWLRLSLKNRLMGIEQKLIFRDTVVGGGGGLSSKHFKMHLGVLKALSKHISITSFWRTCIVVVAMLFEMAKYPVRIFRAS